MNVAKALGGRIRFLRQVHGLTQAELGDRAAIDVANISRLERGRYDHIPTLDTVLHLAAALGEPPSMILVVLDDLAE